MAAAAPGRSNPTNADNSAIPYSSPSREIQPDFAGARLGRGPRGRNKKARNKGTHFGQVIARSSGKFHIKKSGKRMSFSHKSAKIPQRGDDYARFREALSQPKRRRSPIAPKSPRLDFLTRLIRQVNGYA